ncbi:acyltransferase [Colletotrichum incanum]|nr:acyltransferase [Colletotrichum incanum]
MGRLSELISNPQGLYSLLAYDEGGSSSTSEVEFAKTSNTGSRAQIRRAIRALLPSFVSRPLRRRSDAEYIDDHDNGAILPKPNSTSYLNGLRGLASLVVAMQHNTNDYFPANHRGWGDPPGEHHIIQLPLIRLILDGSFAVTIFFVISGFALSYGPLKKMHQGKAEQAISAIPSSVFRRPVRLFTPVVPVLVFSNIVMIRWLSVFYQNETENLLPPQPSFLAELHHTWAELLQTVITGVAPATMPQIWTLAVEYQGSLLIFLCCLTFARVTSVMRMCFVTAIFCWQWYLGQWQLSLFLAGMILADLKLLRPEFPSLGRRTRAVVDAGNWVMLFMALYLGGWPIYGDGGATLGFTYFNWVPTGNVPQQRFWHSVSAIMLVFSLENMAGGKLQSWLNARWLLYLGEISYGLYLVHWMVGMNSLTKGTIIRLRRLPGCSSFLAWLVGFTISMPLCIWVGDLHWRFVDKKSVRLAKWLSDAVGI